MTITRTNMTAAALCGLAFGTVSPRHTNGSAQLSAAVFTFTNTKAGGPGSVEACALQ